jgi:DNA-binding GntR family transcriptional regulator
VSGALKEQTNLHPLIVANLNDAVYDVLRERILQHQFMPGQRLNLNELEDLLQVSRTPLKNALTRLEVEGLVDIQPRRGTYVTTISAARLEETYKIRSAFELYVALCLFKYLKPEDMDFFDEIRAGLDELACAGDWPGVIHDYLQLDQQLHERLVMRGGTPRMLELFQQMNVHMQVARIIPQYEARDFEMIHFEHEQVFAALYTGSPDRLSAALLNHLEASRLRALHHAALLEDPVD